ncbi:DUF6266 family protein [Pedobacter duraquae]|uniref:Uncharacterized protein n=1 Tax=Pedobacter duraquae TaxID=425511 RepID=A0A4R6IGV8_9SPHI|nr:DUF6266 family protein [Pedobacter duraquae]TDO20957.1 hypothetical protein CLV32_3594 [Pedobacter duraquae]
MGIAKQGIYGPMRGKVGQVIWYELNGQGVARGVGYRTAPRTPGEIQSSKTHNVLTSLFKVTQPFIKKGFSGLAEGTVRNYHNLAMSHNRLHAIQMSDQQKPELLFDKLLLSNGPLLIPQEPNLEQVEFGLKFSWDYAEEDHPFRYDRVMMLAYFPNSNQAVFETSGAKRNQLSEVLLINSSLRTETMHVYIAFGSSENSSTSDTIYLGQIN